MSSIGGHDHRSILSGQVTLVLFLIVILDQIEPFVELVALSLKQSGLLLVEQAANGANFECFQALVALRKLVEVAGKKARDSLIADAYKIVPCDYLLDRGRLLMFPLLLVVVVVLVFRVRFVISFTPGGARIVVTPTTMVVSMMVIIVSASFIALAASVLVELVPSVVVAPQPSQLLLPVLSNFLTPWVTRAASVILLKDVFHARP